MKIRAKEIRVGDTIMTPGWPKTYDFRVATVKETKHNIVVTEDNGRQWVMPKDQWVEKCE